MTVRSGRVVGRVRQGGGCRGGYGECWRWEEQGVHSPSSTDCCKHLPDGEPCTGWRWLATKRVPADGNAYENYQWNWSPSTHFGIPIGDLLPLQYPQMDFIYLGFYGRTFQFTILNTLYLSLLLCILDGFDLFPLFTNFKFKKKPSTNWF